MHDIDYQSKQNQLPDSTIFIGFMTRQTLKKLENEGDVSPLDVGKFMSGVRQFYESAIKYILDKFPETLKHAKFIDFEERENVEFTDVEYFVERYSILLQRRWMH